MTDKEFQRQLMVIRAREAYEQRGYAKTHNTPLDERWEKRVHRAPGAGRQPKTDEDKERARAKRRAKRKKQKELQHASRNTESARQEISVPYGRELQEPRFARELASTRKPNGRASLSLATEDLSPTGAFRNMLDQLARSDGAGTSSHHKASIFSREAEHIAPAAHDPILATRPEGVSPEVTWRHIKSIMR